MSSVTRSEQAETAYDSALNGVQSSSNGVATAFSRSRPASNSIAAVMEALKEQFGSRFSTSDSVRLAHGKGESWHPPELPDCVCYPDTTAEVASVMALCHEHKVPVIPFGVGTSLEGHTLAPLGGVSIDLSRMDKVLQVHAEDMDCRVQAGVTRKQLNEYIRDTGLFFPIDPGADATIGGMTATRASGTNAVRYGTMKDNVISLTFVNAKGEVVRTGTRARKSSAGYDLTRLLVGSEGTLGVITEIGLKLHGMPEAMMAAVVSFPDLDAAVETVIQTIQIGIPMARIELVDEAYMDAINNYSKMDYPVRDTLFLEFHGTESYVQEQVDLFAEIAKENGGGDLAWARKEEDRNRLWQARHDAYWAILAKYPGKSGFTTDVCVPISKLAEIIRYVREQVEDSFLEAHIVGHAGDGNFHMIFCIDPDDAGQKAEVYRVNGLLVNKAIDMGGTCTGEHGVGTGKLKYLRREHGDEALAMMQAIKLACDPENILNPLKTIAVDNLV